jgi:enoyl-CoA hydratase/carnithine racemase
VPVIAAIHGHCLGGGLQIALGADIRFATPDARLSVLEVKWGLVPDMAITRTLPRLVGIDVAKELAFTGRMLSGLEAGELGLVTHVVDDPLAAARELASDIAGRSPDSVRGMKRLFNESWTGPAEETLKLEADIQLGLLGTPNQLEAVRAGMLKEPAQFTDPS